MEETIFFDNGSVKVTSARFISGGQTFAMRNITSVKAQKRNPKRLLPALGIFFGLGLANAEPLAGVFVIVASIAYLVMKKSTYLLMLSSASGETRALETKQRDLMDDLINALNAAISHNG